jgi:hypothetical protein
MTLEEARQRIQNAIDQYGAQAAPAIELVMAEVKSAFGAETANEMIEEFDLELRYNVLPTEFD